MENEQVNESDGMKNLREAHDREKARADAAEAELRNLVFTTAGVDTESWVGQQLASAYEGDLSPDAVRLFAQEKGIPLGSMGEQPPQAAMDQLTEQQVAARNQMATTMQGTQPRTAEATPEAKANQALAEGDVRTSIALKAAQLTTKQ
jgi:hypothetical protein